MDNVVDMLKQFEKKFSYPTFINMCIEPSVNFYKQNQKNLHHETTKLINHPKICKLFAAVASFDLEECCNRPTYEELTRLAFLTQYCEECHENNTSLSNLIMNI